MNDRADLNAQKPSGTCLTEPKLPAPTAGSGTLVRFDATVGQAAGTAVTPVGSPKRVLFIVDSFNVGGTESQVAQIAQRLVRLGISVTIGCLKAEGPLLEAVRSAKIEIVEFRLGNSLYALRSQREILRLARFIQKRKFEVVHTHDLWSNLMGVPAAWIARTPIIISSQRDLAHLPWYTPFRRKVIARVHRMADRVVANCSAVRDVLLSEMGISADHVCTIRNGVNVERLAQTQNQRRRFFPEISDDQKLVAVVANMSSPVKGHAYLLDAARKIRESVPGVVFVLIGDGPLRAGLERDISDANLKECFIFLGKRDDAPLLLRCCDISLSPSLAEGLPNAVLEGMAAGLPVIATRVGGIPEIVEDGVSGVLIAPKSGEAIAKAVVQVLQRPEFARRVAAAGHRRVSEEFTFVRTIGQLLELYASVARQVARA